MIMKIAGSISRADGGRVVEIGPGTGAITQVLFKRFPDLEVIEIDQRAVQLLKEQFLGLIIHQQDILKTSWN